MDNVKLGKLAAAALENEAFRQCAEATKDNLRTAFEKGTDEEALAARAEVKALETVLNRLIRMRDKGSHIEREARAKQDQGDVAE